ncbi:hypothetical protein KFZ70_02380 [Tamlana fucoidanivorans]|uniref:Uncharacterized protein n=1 Tax=Allotamlana fucoidanivorans TaxID=2583814 RepID=A0A5C4SBV7_9FLAO|nr:DUF6090 family protein [Tamlana fucoidanivorans]TNJ40773.1 hypothetical protein FGF67_16815 [Tamlana fucoidanivorans]
MIKFFRKIRQNLLSEGKTGKYLKYAIGEIVLVVIGILIALQINNWNESRKESNYEQKFLNELKSDFLYNKEELNRNIKKANNLTHNGDSIIYILSLSKKDVDLIKVFNLTRRLYGYSTFDPSNGGLNNLMSSGNLNIIKNDSLRMNLSKWPAMVEDVKEDEKRLIEYGDTYLEPHYLKYFYYESGSRLIDPTLLEDVQFENIVRTIRGRANYIVENYKILEIEIDKILTEIQGEVSSNKE